MSKKLWFTVAQYVIFFGLGVLLIWWQADRITPEDKIQISQSLGQAADRAWLLIPVFIMGILSHVFRALRWKLLLEPVDIKPDTVNITGAVLIGYLVNLLLPRMGEVARCTVLARYERKPADKIIGTIVAERSFDLICLILIAAATFFLQAGMVSRYMEENMAAFSSKGPVLLMVAGLGIAGLLAGIFIYRRIRHSRVGQFIGGILTGIMAIARMRRSGLFLFHSAMIWLCYLMQIYFGFFCLSATEDLSILAALSVLVFGSIGMIITPGGLGAYPLALQNVLLVYGVGSAHGFAFGWIAWSAQTILILVLGILAFMVIPAYNRNRHGQTSVDHP